MIAGLLSLPGLTRFIRDADHVSTGPDIRSIES